MRSVAARASILLVTVALVAARAAPPLFSVPLAWPTPTQAELEALPARLQAQADALAARPGTGYDWVFPSIYSKTSRSILGASGTGFFEDRPLVDAEVGAFFEIYAANSDAWLAGRRAEPGWAFCAGLSRRMAGLYRGDPHEAKAAALIQAFATIYVHVAIDLPRALFLVRQRLSPARSLELLRTTHSRVTACFYPVIEELIREARITPGFLAKVWPKLPGWMRSFLLKGRLGFGSYLRLLRSLAWLRFRNLARNARHAAEVQALPGRPGLFPLGEPPAGPAAPGTRLAPGDLDRLGAQVFALDLGL